MVMMCHRAHSPAGVGAAVPAMVEVSTQTELWVVDTALEVPSCREYLVPLPEAGRDGLLSWCAAVAELCCRVEELWEGVSIRDDERGRHDLLRDLVASRAPDPNCCGDTGRVCPYTPTPG